jgi:hypothetical protein
MRKLLPWIIGGVLGVVLGVTGTYAADRFRGDDETRLCRAWTQFVSNYPQQAANPTVEPSELYKVGHYSKAYLDYWDQIYTIRSKVCS